MFGWKHYASLWLSCRFSFRTSANHLVSPSYKKCHPWGNVPTVAPLGSPAAPLQQWRRDFCHLENPKKETMNFPSAWHSKQGNPFSVTMDDTSHVLGRFHDFKWNDIIARVLGALHQG